MDAAEGICARKSSSEAADSERTEELKERLEGLLREAAEVEVELSRADGTIKGIPHYSPGRLRHNDPDGGRWVTGV